MNKVLWVVLAVAVVCFVSCSKEGPAGPTGTAGAAGATGAAGTPRRMYIETRSDSGYSYTQGVPWVGTITLPWTPAANGVIANYRGHWTSNTAGYADGGIYDVAVSGRTVTVSGWIWAQNSPYSWQVFYDVIAYDTLTTVLFINKTRPAPPMLRKNPTSIAKTTLP